MCKTIIGAGISMFIIILIRHAGTSRRRRRGRLPTSKLRNSGTMRYLAKSLTESTHHL
jgi:hypothetical protein